MKRNELIAVALILLATVGAIAGVFAIEKFRLTNFYTIEVIARAPENGGFYPGEITVPVGKKVRLLIRNIETVSHGFAIPDLNVSAGEIKAGHVAVVEFIPDRAGVFPFMCTVWCSEHHLQMTGKLRVIR